MSVLPLFTGSVRVDDRPIVVRLAGEIDIATMPQFQALIDESLALGAGLVIFDMAAVEFLDAGGLGVLVNTAERLRLAGSAIEVRGVSARTYRVFEMTGLVDALGVRRPAGSSALTRGLAGAAGIPLSREVLDAALKMVVTMAQAVVVGADGVSITLPRNGRLGTVASSNDVVLEMDHDQYETGEGPCLDAATQGERFHIQSLGDEDRWPDFVPRARARGIESILSTPLVASDRPVGALNVYSRTVAAFAAHEKKWMDQFAAEASAVVSSAQRSLDVEIRNEQIEEALRSRELIAWAQGMVMHRDNVSAAEAHDILRDISRRTGRPLRDVCDELARSGDGRPHD